MSSILSPFSNWQNFYVIVGSAAGALTGLQFIVITLIAQTGTPGNMRGIRAFGTPTVSHFCTSLLISALMVMPWQEPLALCICLGVCGTVGFAYCIRNIWHARQSTYNPDFEDWLWYTVFPATAHIMLVVAASLLRWKATWTLFTVAADALLFLFVGIHNAWDTVTYIAITQRTTPSSTDAGDRDKEGNAPEPKIGNQN